VLPWFDSSNLKKNQGARSLGRANKRKLDFLSHGKFRDRLVHTLGDPSQRSNQIQWITEEYSP
jgi:hypothetical protein